MDTANRWGSTLILRSGDDRLWGGVSSGSHYKNGEDTLLNPHNKQDTGFNCWARSHRTKSIPVFSAMGVAKLKARGWGVVGAGRSPIRKPGRNCAPDVGLGEVGDPKVIGSVPTKRKRQADWFKFTESPSQQLQQTPGFFFSNCSSCHSCGRCFRKHPGQPSSKVFPLQFVVCCHYWWPQVIFYVFDTI